jgi:hypothetical protein
VTWPAGADFAEVSHVESAAVTWIASPPFASLFAVQADSAVSAAAATAAVAVSRTARMRAPSGNEW